MKVIKSLHYPLIHLWQLCATTQMQLSNSNQLTSLGNSGSWNCIDIWRHVARSWFIDIWRHVGTCGSSWMWRMQLLPMISHNLKKPSRWLSMNRHNSFICSILLIPANQTNKLTNCMPTVRYDLDMRCRRWPTCTLPQSSTPQIKWPIDLTDQTLIENCRWRSYFIPPPISFTSEYLETLLGTMDLAPTGMTRKTHLSGWIAQESLFCPPLAKLPGNATQQPMMLCCANQWLIFTYGAHGMKIQF